MGIKCVGVTYFVTDYNGYRISPHFTTYFDAVCWLVEQEKG